MAVEALSAVKACINECAFMRMRVQIGCAIFEAEFPHGPLQQLDMDMVQYVYARHECLSMQACMSDTFAWHMQATCVGLRKVTASSSRTWAVQGANKCGASLRHFIVCTNVNLHSTTNIDIRAVTGASELGTFVNRIRDYRHDCGSHVVHQLLQRLQSNGCNRINLQ